ncbi:hypothetical protein LCGC14_0503850 [marine sediment metagenome]|uniref:Uncharacterized protein n=1 Tax=marine sediment metagenome TaxID=412755 RepID=A0A0F9SLP8_9ZZZZ
MEDSKPNPNKENQEVRTLPAETVGFKEDPIVFSGSESELEAFNKKTQAPPSESGQPPKEPDAAASQSASSVEGGKTPPETLPEPIPGETPVKPPSEETPAVKETPPAETTPATIPSQTPPEADLLTDEQYFTHLNQETGLDIKSDEELYSSIKGLKAENTELKDKVNLDPYSGVSELLKKAIEYEKKGGNVKTFLSMTSIDTQGMSSKELVRQKFFNDNPELVKLNSEFAAQKFDRAFDDKYGILEEDKTEDDFDDNIDYLKWQESKAFAKNELDYESRASAQNIDDLKKDIMDKDPETMASAQSKVDEEALRKTQEKYETDSNKFKEEFESIAIPLDAKGENLFNIGLNKDTKPVFEKWLENPSSFFEHIGLSNDGKNIDAEVFGGHIALVAALEGTGESAIGSAIVKYVLENFDKETLETKLEHPAEPRPDGEGGDREQTEEKEAIGKLSETTGNSYKPYFYDKDGKPKQ